MAAIAGAGAAERVGAAVDATLVAAIEPPPEIEGAAVCALAGPIASKQQTEHAAKTAKDE